MASFKHTPAAPLGALVESMWYFRADGRPETGRQTAMPTGKLGIIVPLGDNQLSFWNGAGDASHHRHDGLAVIGALSRRIALDSSQLGEVLGISLRPGAAHALFGPSAREFQDTHTPLADLWGSGARSLHDRLREEPSPRAKFAILERELVRRACRPLARDPAILRALERMRLSPEDAMVRSVAAGVGMTPKQFSAHFAAHVGVTPRLYGRIQRFRRVLEDVHRMPAIEWTRIAQDHGYYDQSHLTREFRELSGFTPTEYARRRGPSLEHVDLEVAEIRTSGAA